MVIVLVVAEALVVLCKSLANVEISSSMSIVLSTCCPASEVPINLACSHIPVASSCPPCMARLKATCHAGGASGCGRYVAAYQGDEHLGGGAAGGQGGAHQGELSLVEVLVLVVGQTKLVVCCRCRYRYLCR